MAYASEAFATPEIRMPPLKLPKLRRPHVSQRTRAFLMMGVLCSPIFLCDSIGYWIQRITYTADQIADKQSPNDTIMTHVRIFPVACSDPASPASEQQRWADTAAENGWPMYPEAGPGCFKPNRSLLGIVGLKTFSVACPAIAFAPIDQRRWLHYAADHGWTDYSQAGEGCVDP